MVTTAVMRSLQLVGADTTHFSGASMRRGGISAALTAKVPALVLYLQSGHGGKMAAENYMTIGPLRIPVFGTRTLLHFSCEGSSLTVWQFGKEQKSQDRVWGKDALFGQFA